MNLKSRYEDVVHFSKSDVWSDIVTLLSDSIEAIKDELSVTDDMKTVYRMQGEISGIGKALTVIDVLKDLLKKGG